MIHRTYCETRIPQLLDHPESASNKKLTTILEGNVYFLTSELMDLPVQML